MSIDTSISAGQLLLAEPFMLDPNFRRSVVLLCEHKNDEGTLGFILNKPLKMQVRELIADFPAIESEVYYGGPVATDTIHYLHDAGNILDESIEVGNGIFWGGNFEKLKFLIDSQLIKEENVRFYVGYSGWSEGQLQGEMEIGSWISSNMDPNYLFNASSDQLWKKVLASMGSPYEVIAQMPNAHRLN